MKLLTVIIFLIFISGCAGTRQEVRVSSIDNITPDGCYYNFQSDLFHCTDRSQEAYLNSHPFTDKEMEQLGDLFIIDETFAVKMVMRLHDCAVRIQDNTLVCNYSLATNILERGKQNGSIISESKKDGTFVYLLGGD